MTASRSTRPSRRRRAAVLATSATTAAVTLACLTPAARAQTWTGNGTDSNWTTAANWSAAPANNGTAAVVFNGTNKLTPVVNSPYSINSLTFTTTAGAFSLSGNTLTLGAGGITDSSASAQTLATPITLAAPQTWLASAGALTVSGTITNGGNLLTVTGPADTTLSGILSGTGGLTKTGTGSLTLTGSAANTFTGPTTVSNGTLTLNKTAGVPALSGNVNLTGGKLAINQSSNVGPESVITETGGTLNLPANPVIGGLLLRSGAFFWGGGPITLTGTADNVLSVTGNFGNFNIPFNLTGATGGGITNLDATSATLAGAINLGNNLRSITVNDNAAADDLVISGAISNGALAKDGPGTLALTGTNTYTGITLLDQGTLRVAADTALGASASPLTFNGGTFQASNGFSTPRPVNVTINGGTINVPSTPLTFAGTLAGSGSGALSKTGTGTLILGGGPSDTVANPYSGTFTVSAGTLTLDKAPNTPALSGDLVINGGTVNFNAAGLLSTSADVTMGPSVVHFGDTNTFGSFSLINAAFNYTINGTMTLTSTGTALTLSSPGFGGIAIFNPFHFTGATGGSISVSSNNGYTLNGAIDLGGPTRTVSVLKGPLTINNVISNGGVTKTGTGSLTLGGTAPNTYTGPTTVNDGTLVLADSAGNAVRGNLTVNAPGIVQLQADQQIDPSASLVTINGGTLDLNGHSQATQAPLTLNGATVAGGTLDLNGNIALPANGGTSTISSDIAVGAGTKTIDVEQNSLDATGLHLTGVVSGTGGLLLTGVGYGGGNVHFAGAASNTFTGGATVQSYVYLDNAPGTVALPGPVTIGGGTNYGDVIINTDNAIATSASLTVLPNGGLQIQGNHSQTVTSLYLDGDLSGGTLVLAPGGTGTIGPDAFVSAISTVVNNGTLTLAGPNFNGKLLNNGSLSFAADFKLTGAGSFTNSGTFTLPAGRTISTSLGVVNLGTATLAGGTLNGNYVENDNNLAGFGAITGYSFINSGYVSVTGGTLNLAATINATSTGNIDVQPGGQLQLSNPLNNAGALTLLGGSVTPGPSAAGTLTNTGLVAGRGTISAPLANSGGTLQPQGGSLNVTTPFTNNGVIQLTPGSSLLGAQITNAGTIQGAGTLSNPISNSTGTLEPTGGTLNLTAQFTNSATGLIRVGAGNKALFQNLPTNAGTISLAGGTLDTANHPLTNSGQLTGYGTLATGGLTNNGAITLTGGPTTVNGPLTNSPGQTIKVQYQPAIFTSPVTNNGTFTVLSTTATFAGGFAGSAPSEPSLSLSTQNSALSTSPSLAGTLSIDPAGSVLANYVRQDTLTSSGSLAIRPTSLGGDTSALNTLTLSPGSTFDLADTRLILTTTPADVVRQYLLTHDLFSSTADADPQHRLALAYATASQLQATTWGGLPVAPTSLLTKLTYQGDANLDGTINADDYALLDRGFASHGTTWTSGDFNYDGTVDQNDYLLIDRTVTLQSGNFTPDATLVSEREAQFGPAYVSALITSIPEPTSMAACGLALLPFLTRRRRKPF